MKKHWIPYVVGIITTLLTGAGFLTVGIVYRDNTPQFLIESITPSVRTLCFAIITASSTVTALMLNMLGMSKQADIDFDDTYYKMIKWVALSSTSTIILATTILLFVSIPLTEADQLKQWFQTALYLMMGLTSVLAGVFLGMIAMLYDAVTDVINSLAPTDNL